jgi:hypothetical protein
MKTIVPTASILLLTLFALPASRPVHAQDAIPNFTGTWTIDLAKSDFGPMPPPDSVVHTIEHKEPNIKIVTAQKSAQGESTNERMLTTDGKPNVNKVRMGGPDQEVTSTSKWVGKTLNTIMKVDIQGTPLDFNDTWKLSDDGKVLTIVREIKSPQGDFAATTVFNKQ